MKEIEYILNSLEVAEMLEVDHWVLLRKLKGRTGNKGKHIKGYVEILGDNHVVVSDFFRESSYFTAQNKEMPCYQVTKKGCEFLANKFAGEKGVLFTARYINRFHEMQDILSQKESEPQLPWFIRKFRGKYIMLFRDFKSLTGVELFGNRASWKREYRLRPNDWNGWAWHTTINREEFLKEYGFDYGDDDCMMYLYPCGIKRALDIYKSESGKKLDKEVYDMIADGLKMLEPPKKRIENKKEQIVPRKKQTITITLDYDDDLV